MITANASMPNAIFAGMASPPIGMSTTAANAAKAAMNATTLPVVCSVSAGFW